MRTEVYFNLHKRVWSLRDARKGVVYDHARVVVSSLPVTLVVRLAGQKQVLREKRKNVHAFVRGDYLEPNENVAGWQAFAEAEKLIPVSYNPYRGPSFYRKDTDTDLSDLQSVILIAPPDGPPTMWGQV